MMRAPSPKGCTNLPQHGGKRELMRKLSAIVLSVVLLMIAACDQQSNAPKSGAGVSNSDKTKLGFIVKQPEEPWFQLEWKFAEEAGAKNGFEVIKIGATDGEKALSAIDNLAAAGAQGFIICTPDVKLGPAIVTKAKANNLKLMTVDDQF